MHSIHSKCEHLGLVDCNIAFLKLTRKARLNTETAQQQICEQKGWKRKNEQ